MQRIQLTDNFDEWRRKFNENFAVVGVGVDGTGDLGDLMTVDKTTLVAAINELYEAIQDTGSTVNMIDGGGA